MFRVDGSFVQYRQADCLLLTLTALLYGTVHNYVQHLLGIILPISKERASSSLSLSAFMPRDKE